MNHALFLNCLIIAVVLVGIVVGHNPLFLVGLTFLQDMPYGLLAARQLDAQSRDEEDDEQPMGFTADVK